MNYLNSRPLSFEVWGRQAPHADTTGELNTKELMKKDSVMVSGGAKVSAHVSGHVTGTRHGAHHGLNSNVTC